LCGARVKLEFQVTSVLLQSFKAKRST